VKLILNGAMRHSHEAMLAFLRRRNIQNYDVACFYEYVINMTHALAVEDNGIAGD